MKYRCRVIRDLLPLYVDGVCSEESCLIVEEHIKECEECRNLLEEMTHNSSVPRAPENPANEQSKANGFRKLKKNVMKKHIVVALASFALAVASFTGIVYYLGTTVRTVKNAENIKVAMEGGEITGKLFGSRVKNMTIKNVYKDDLGSEKYTMFFCIGDTRLEDLMTGNDEVSSFVLCPKEKGADKIEKIDYYTGDYSDLEEMTNEELKAVTDNAELVWSRNNS